MKKITSVIALMTFFSGAVFAATLNITVKDQDGNPIPNAKIMLTTYYEDDVNHWWIPDTARSTMTYTDSGGLKTCTIEYGLIKDSTEDYNKIYRNYQLLVTAQGYSPSTREQMMDWRWGQQWVWVTPFSIAEVINKTVTLTSGLAGVTEASVLLTYQPGKVFFGEIRNGSTWETIVMETFVTTDTINTFTFSNVPTGMSNLRVNVYCPADQKGRERSFNYITVPIDLNSEGMSSSSKVDTSQTGNPVFEGVIQSTTTDPIANARVNIYDREPGYWAQAQTITDANGYFVFYDNLKRITDGVEEPFFNVTDEFQIDVQAQGYEGKSYGPYYYSADANFSLGVSTLAAVYGVISGTVTLEGEYLPNVHVNVWGDWSSWDGTDDYAYDPAYPYISKSARGGGFCRTDDGTFEITGLAPGNYRLEIYSDFTQQPYCFNNGADRQEDFDSNVRAGDDYRIAVDTINTSTGELGVWKTKVYDATGYEITSGSYPLVINIPANKSAQGTISGTITYDETLIQSGAILGGAGNVFMIIARQDWSTYEQPEPGEPWTPPACGFKSVEGSGTSFDYTIYVSTGYLYNMEVKSKNYGVVRSGGWEMKADLREGRTSVSGMDFIITPGGTVKGKVLLPDGSVFRPVQGDNNTSMGCNVNIHGRNIECWNNAEVKDDGTFEINGLVPGMYEGEVYGWGGLYRWASPRIQNILVKPGGVGQIVSTEIEIKLKPGERCYPNITGDVVEAADSLPKYTSMRLVGVPAGTKLNNESMKSLLMDDTGIQFHMQDGANYWEPRFLAYGMYDFYFCVMGDTMDKGEGDYINTMDHNILYYYMAGEAKNVEINDNPQGEIPDSHPYSGGQPCHLITIDTVLGDATIYGFAGGKNLFSNADLTELAKNEDLIVDFIPSVVVYDVNGSLKGWGMAIPSPEGIMQLDQMLLTKDFTNFLSVMSQYPLRYTIELLPEGVYTFIAATPNYPPFAKNMTIAGTVNQNIDFDTDVGPGGVIKGVVSDADGNPLAGATLTLKSSMKNKTMRTDESGSYEFSGLPKGRYVVEVSKSGYALVGAKKDVEKNASIQLNFNLTLAPGSFSGTVYLQKMPSPRVYPGARITAYDDTFNGLYPDEYLPAYSVTTDVDGRYTISGVLSGHVYKIFLLVDGKQLEYIERTATVDEVTGCDFVLRSEAPKLNVKSKISTDGASISFTVVSGKTLTGDLSYRYQEGTVYNDGIAAIDTGTAQLRLNNEYQLSITPPETDKDYVLRLSASDGVNEEVNVDTVFNLSLKAKVKKDVKSEMVEGGDVLMDTNTDDLTSLGIPTGGLTPTEDSGSIPNQIPGITGNVAVGGFISTLPGVQISKSNRNASTILLNLIESVLASDLYTIDLTNAQINRDLTISLNYDKTKVTDLDALTVYQYNSTDGTWNVVDGTTMVDPITGTISVDVDSIAGASGVASAPGMNGKSRFDGSRHAINLQASTDQTGTFAVFAAPPVDAKAYTGDAFKAYNFPNPFNLESKTVPLADDATAGTSMTTTGTVIKYYVPSSVSGKTQIYIYNIAGEMVRHLDEGERQGGYIYYAEWNGKNDNGSSVASGVYICMIQVNDEKKITFKMAVIK